MLSSSILCERVAGDTCKAKFKALRMTEPILMFSIWLSPLGKLNDLFLSGFFEFASYL